MMFAGVPQGNRDLIVTPDEVNNLLVGYGMGEEDMAFHGDTS